MIKVLSARFWCIICDKWPAHCILNILFVVFFLQSFRVAHQVVFFAIYSRCASWPLHRAFKMADASGILCFFGNILERKYGWILSFQVYGTILIRQSAGVEFKWAFCWCMLCVHNYDVYSVWFHLSRSTICCGHKIPLQYYIGNLWFLYCFSVNLLINFAYLHA